MFRPLSFRERFPREPLRSTLVRAIEKAQQLVNHRIATQAVWSQVVSQKPLSFADQIIFGAETGFKSGGRARAMYYYLLT